MTDLQKRSLLKIAALTAVASAALVGCGKKEEPAPAPKPAPVASAPAAKPEPLKISPAPPPIRRFTPFFLHFGHRVTGASRIDWNSSKAWPHFGQAYS